MDFLSSLNPMAVAALTFLIIGVVEFVRRLYAKDWMAATTIAVAGIVGALFATQVDITWFQGLLVGFSASGLITTVSRVNPA